MPKSWSRVSSTSSDFNFSFFTSEVFILYLHLPFQNLQRQFILLNDEGCGKVVHKSKDSYHHFLKIINV